MRISFFATLAAGLIASVIGVVPARAQNQTCPTAPNGDSTNKCASTKFVQQAIGAPGTVVNSFNGRSGVVTPQTGDYSFPQVSGIAGLAQGGLGGSQAGATANQIPVCPGGGGACVPTSVGGTGGFFDTICSSTIGQAWVRLSSGWGCLSLGYANPMWWGAKGNGVTFTANATIGSSSPNLSVSAGTFTNADIGKTIAVPGAGTAGAALVTTILSVTSTTSITLNANASTAISGISTTIFYGTDDTSAFTSAMAVGGLLFVPCNTYLVSSVLTLNFNNQSVSGAGRGCVVTKTVSATANVFAMGGALSNNTIAHLTVDRAVTATGGSGIDMTPSVGGAFLEDLAVYHHFVGLTLGNTDFSPIQDVFVGFGQSDGIVFTNGATGNAAAQWQLYNVTSGQNAGRGVRYQCNGTGAMSTGQINGLATFANSGVGIAFIGSATCPINGIRMINSFLGQDGNDEIFLSTFGAFPHAFTAVTVELAGTSATGPTLSTPASNTGDGFTISANEPLVTISNPVVNAMSLSGIRNNGSQVTVIGGTVANNGQAGAAPGIIADGRMIIEGVTIGNTGANTSQNFGVQIPVTGGDNSIISHNDIRNNATSPFSLVGGLTHTVITENLGYNPVGLTAGTSTGTSASTISAGSSSETHYITQSATFNAAVKSGATTLCTVATATVPCVIQLGPNESYSVTWATTQPTYSKFVH